MRKVVLLLVVLFLVNLPWVDEKRAEHRISGEGRLVPASLLAARHRGDHYFVDYRLPPAVDPGRRRFSAEVDVTTYEAAEQSKVLPVRVVRGDPATNRPEGQVRSATFTVVAVLGDAVALAIAVLWWRRRRRWHRLEVLGVADGVVRLRGSQGELTAAAPGAWTTRAQAGRRVTGRFHLVADEDVAPALPVSGLEQLSGAAYAVHGRVVDTRRGWVDLVLDDGFRLRVETGPHRISADIRDSTGVRGTLCFTPTRFV